MADILDRLGSTSDNQLAKLLLELLGSAVLNAQKEKEKPYVSSTPPDEIKACKSVPVSPRGHIATTEPSKSDNEAPTTRSDNDSSLGRPRYQWKVPESCTSYEKDSRRKTAVSKDLFSVYVGHLPCDITEGELMDLFKDIGEVADSFVYPTQNRNGYTYGFVRFLTLDEAKDAVREKNLQVLGTRQIHVELASETRQRLQNDDNDEDDSRLLRKDYPKVVRRPTHESDDKMVMDKIKTSLCKLKTGKGSTASWILGDHSVGEVFENLQTILKMIINYPMTSADASADEGNIIVDLTQNAKTVATIQCKPQLVNEHRHILSTHAGQGLSELSSLNTTGRIPSQTVCEPQDTICESSEDMKMINVLPPSGLEGLSPQTTSSDMKCPLTEQLDSSLMDKVQDFLNSSCNNSSSDDCMSFTKGQDKPDVSTTNVLNQSYASAAKKYLKSKSEGKLDKDFASYRQLTPNQFFAKDRDLVLPVTCVIDRNGNRTVSPPSLVDHSSENNSTSLSSNVEHNEVISIEDKPITAHTPLPLHKDIKDISPNLSNANIPVGKPDNTDRRSFKPADNTSKTCRNTSQSSSVTVGQEDSSTKNTDSKGDTLPTSSNIPPSNGNYNSSFVDNFNSMWYAQSLPTTVSSNISSCSCNFNGSSSSEINMNVKQGITKANGSKSSTRRDRSLAPSFAKPFVRHSGDNNASSFPANDSSYACTRTSKHFPLIDMLPTNVEKKADELLDDRAVLHISARKYVSRNSNGSPVNGFSVRMGIQVEKSNQDNFDDLASNQSYPETIKLKQHLKHQREKLNELQGKFAEFNSHREKSRVWFENSACSDLEVQIHDAEVTLQKKIEIWSSRRTEQDLAYEREMLQSVDNKGLLSQLAKEIKIEQLRNEVSGIELKCKILEMKIKLLQERRMIRS